VTTARAGGLDIGTEFDDGHAVVTVDGEIDVYSAMVLREQLAALSAAGHHRIAINLAAMTFCDSTGLGVLVSAAKRAKAAGGGLALVGVRENTLQMLRITGLVKVIPPFSQLAEACAHLDAQ
jgi:anti-sigma B factor antagonist